jgi:hypothetical protein
MILSHRTAAPIGAIPGSPEKYRPFFFCTDLVHWHHTDVFLGLRLQWVTSRTR